MSATKKQRKQGSESPVKHVKPFQMEQNEATKAADSMMAPPPPLSQFITTSTTNSGSGNSPGDVYPLGDPTEWNCEQVYQFVNCVAGVNVAALFRAQEVDGSALALIRDDHLVNTMQIKLGPALKIMSKFNELTAKYNATVAKLSGLVNGS